MSTNHQQDLMIPPFDYRIPVCLNLGVCVPQYSLEIAEPVASAISRDGAVLLEILEAVKAPAAMLLPGRKVGAKEFFGFLSDSELYGWLAKIERPGITEAGSHDWDSKAYMWVYGRHWQNILRAAARYCISPTIADANPDESGHIGVKSGGCTDMKSFDL